jgi:ABC-2 type transport system permease protein
MIATFTASGYLLQSVVDEKENYTIEIILTSVKPFPLLFGKTLAMGLVGLLQIGVWAISIAILLNTTSLDLPEVGKLEVKPETVVVAMVYFLFGYLFTGSIFAAMGSLVNNARDGSQLAGWIIFPTIAPLFFTTVFAEEPNTTLPTLLSIMPFTAPLGMVMRVAVTDVPLYQILISLIGVTATSLLGIWIAGRLFRVSSLLRGTPPRIRDIPRLIWEKT